MIDRLDQAAKHLDQWADKLKKPEPERIPRFTDTGNAERLLARFGDRLRYCPPWGKWLEWTGERWRPDEKRLAEHYWDLTVRGIYQEAQNADDPKVREAIAEHAVRSESAAKGRAALEVAGRNPSIVVVPDQLDRDPWLLNVQNGTLDLRRVRLRPHQQDDLITKLAPVMYRPDARCPTWKRFLHRVLDGDEELIAYIQRAMGYSLSGNTSEHVIHIPHGTGANGKTTFSETFRGMLGDYATVTPAETLLLKRYDGIPNDLAALKGARAVMAAETEQGRALAESKVKHMTGGDAISARFMRGEWFQFRPQFKVWLSTNHKPIIRGTDHAIWRRIRLVPFTVTIPEGEQDADLIAKLRAEWSGILAWAVEGCLEWQGRGLDPPDAVLNATRDYQTEMDILGDFLDDRCSIDPQAEVSSKSLYAAYVSWCEDTGERPRSQRAFGMALAERGFTKERRRGGVTWRGVSA